MRTLLPAPLGLLLPLLLAGASLAEEPPLLTVAESSGYTRTARHAEVEAFVEALARRSPLVTRASLGRSGEGRDLPLLVLADPPVASPGEAKKPVALVLGNIHAGEVCGKEALLMLARELAAARASPILEELVVVLAPIYNADGNERMSRANRPGQVGPAEGTGRRTNAAGLDLNRDYVKLESPEARALARFCRRWRPAVVIDTHTTDGSRHGYTLTYAGPRHPAGDPRVVEFVRDRMLPAVSARLESETGYRSFLYGNFAERGTAWRMYPALPRYGTVYHGLRNRVAILSEAYAYAPYRDRVLATKAFVRGCLGYVAGHAGEVRELVRAARPGAEVAIRTRPAPPRRAVVLAEAGEREVDLYDREVPALTVPPPYAYLFPPRFSPVADDLLRHGIAVEETREEIELDVEVYRIDSFTRAAKPYQGHRLVQDVRATRRRESRRIPAGWLLVRVREALPVCLLEPRAEDGLVAWNFFDAELAPGADFPVLRLPAEVEILRRPVRPLPEDRVTGRRATLARPPNLSGPPVRGLAWLPDGEHFLERKGGRLYRVRAETGRASLFYDPARIAAALAGLPAIDARSAARLAARPLWDPARERALFAHRGDLYTCRRDGTDARRLTGPPGPALFPRFDPTGRRVAFVRGDDLHVADVATGKERALTTGGGGGVHHGRLDWVYEEEVYGRGRGAAFWWSPDGKRLAFLEVDDRPVGRYLVRDPIPVRGRILEIPWPKAGEPNPVVRVGVVPAAGGEVGWVDLSAYPKESRLVTRVGWKPGGEAVWLSVQDRAQTRLDLLTAPATGGEPTRLLRETTGAWVSAATEPRWLPDGSFLLPSERTGWRHLYRYRGDGKLLGALTSGEWEVRSIAGVDFPGGKVYVTGTRDSHLRTHLYRVPLAGGEVERLTRPGASHRTSLSPRGDLFLDTASNHRSPARVTLRRVPDGGVVRVLDTNPVPALEEVELGRYELVEIETEDGFTLSGSLLYPVDFDPKRRYPVWFTTYGGPHAPTVTDAWRRGGFDEVLSAWGIVVFRADPRSASGKGAVSAWAAYRKLGVTELADIETAIRWLARKPWVDASRIGMGGHSYGGFLTAYALTHSKLFCCGIAGAPVTDWRNYDTIYTERYLDTPARNPEGYAVSSCVAAAKNLHGRLLLLHGGMDDNVHLENTLQLADALQRANREFEMMIYPRSRHGLGGAHARRLRADFIRRRLLE